MSLPTDEKAPTLAEMLSRLPEESKKGVVERGELIYQVILCAQGLRDQGRFDEAADVCRQAIERDSFKTDAAAKPSGLGVLHEYLGETLWKAGQLDEARDHLETAMRILDTYHSKLPRFERQLAAQCKERLACVLEAQGEMEEARKQRLKGEDRGEMLCSNWALVCPVFDN
jgi:tetratricopeptide (TPR) repeat protein